MSDGIFVSSDLSFYRQHTNLDNWDLIVPGNFFGDGSHTDLFFYKRASGGVGQFVVTWGDGHIANQRPMSFDNDWDLIVPGNFGGGSHTDLFFYKRASDGVGWFVATDGNGNISHLQAYTSFGNWDLIVPGNFGGSSYTDLFFYKRAFGGWGQFITTDGHGNIAILRQDTIFDNDWDLIIPGDFFGGSSYTDLFFYKRASGGAGLFVTTDGQGNISDLRRGRESNNWHLIIPGYFSGSLGRWTDLFFYSRL